METTKKWYSSVSIWASIVVILNAVLAMLSDPAFGIISPEIALKLVGVINVIAGAMGIKGRIDANTKIG